jgi:protein O-GlcNAc transferase
MVHPRTFGDWFETGNRLYAAGNMQEAVAAYRRAIDIQPNFPDSYNNLANALIRLADFPGAIAAYQNAIRLRPEFSQAHHNLGALLQRMERWPEAAEAYRNAVRIDPKLPADVHNQLGIVLFRARQFRAAVDAFRQAIAINPNFAEALNNLANVYQELQNPVEAIACYRRAAVLRPDSPEIFNNLGNVLKETGQLDYALAAQHRAVVLRPDYADAYNNLANTLKDTRRLDQALACYDSALAINPSHVVAHSGKVYTLHFHPESTPASLAAAHREWNARHAAKVPRMASHRNTANPDRRLRIGYVSPDFRDHVVGRFLLPLLANHDHRQVELFAYASVTRPDAQVGRFKNHFETWRDVAHLSDEALAELIHSDKIDILVDLTMHMAGSRLLAFARKPAPVQLTYLAYCSTTGLDAMDYRLTDNYLDPPGSSEEWYSEKSLHLRSYWCYEAPENAPPVAARSGPITFGCLNNFCKVSNTAVETWGKLMNRIANSRLIIHAHAGTHRSELITKFASMGIADERIEFVGFAPLHEYLNTYARIDIGLDPFPYAGGTTTCDALWMGVPVVSLAGTTAVSRAGRSILTQIGLPGFVAESVDEYIEKAATLAADSDRLKSLRVDLRDRMTNSPLMDATGFARDVERVYRDIWQKWCMEQSAGT